MYVVSGPFGYRRIVGEDGVFCRLGFPVCVFEERYVEYLRCLHREIARAVYTSVGIGCAFPE